MVEVTRWSNENNGRNRANHESGAFAEYAIAKAAVQRKIPDNMSFEEAATLGVAIMTVVRAKFPSPSIKGSR